MELQTKVDGRKTRIFLPNLKPRICKVCGIEKDRNEFTNGKPTATLKTCRDCRKGIAKKNRQENSEAQRKYDRERYQAQKDRRVKYAREYRKLNPNKTRETNWKAKYGISAKQFYQKLEQQENKCAICGRNMDDYGKIFAVDHCHTTGKIRGLLCAPCNYGLGFYEKHKDKYVAYLKHWK